MRSNLQRFGTIGIAVARHATHATFDAEVILPALLAMIASGVAGAAETNTT